MAWAKNKEQLPAIKSYVQKFLSNQSTATEYLQAILENTKIQGKSVLLNALLIICLSKIRGVHSQNIEQLKNLLQAIAELVWCLSPHSKKFKNCGASLPIFFSLLIKYNDLLSQA